MKAIIFELEHQAGVGSLDVAGRSVLYRQLQLLRDRGIEDVVVEVCDGSDASARADFLLGTDPLVSRVIVIPSATPLGARELARRAGIAHDELYVALPADTLVSTTAALDTPMRARVPAPQGVHVTAAELTVERQTDGALSSVRELDGWGARVGAPSLAHELACAALEGRVPGVMIHGAESKPGVWLARGARILEGALVHPPVLLGVDAVVMARAQVGPRATLGDRVVVDRDAVVVEATVSSDVIVGEGTVVRQARAEAQGITNFADASRTSVVDSLVLTSRRARTTSLASRVIALAMLLLLALPWVFTALARKLAGQSSLHALPAGQTWIRIGTIGVSWLDLCPALFDAVQGRRDLVGIGDGKTLEMAFARPRARALRAGVFDISKALAPGASTSTILRMWHWYQAHKNTALDRHLWGQKQPAETSPKHS